ncbi:MAG: glutamine synthetase family protein [Aliishimia sp.]
MGAIKDGALARMGLLTAAQCGAAESLIARMAEFDTIRVLFPDQHGILRGKTLVASALSSVFTSGIRAPSTLLLKDTSHRTVFPVWEADGAPEALQGAGDILLAPDPEAFYPLPWASRSAWLICTAVQLDGTPLPFAPQTVLERAVAALREEGLALTVGLEVEFHIFAVTDPALTHTAAAMPNKPPQTTNLAPGYQFLTEQRYDRLADVLDEIRSTLQALGLPLRTLEIEMGPSQVELTFDPASPETHALNMCLLRTAVKEVCHRAGLHASFMCHPVVDNAAASGWHIHQSLTEISTGQNVMIPTSGLDPRAGGWIAGLLAHCEATCLLMTPTVNGYKRYRPHQLAPDRIQWGRDNRGAMVRALMTQGDPASRCENRAPEPAANPWYVFAAQIWAGLAGITDGLPLPDAVETPYDTDAPRLPTDMGTAIDYFEGSDFIKKSFGHAFADYYASIKTAEWRRYLGTLSAWEQAEYFDLY